MKKSTIALVAAGTAAAVSVPVLYDQNHRLRASHYVFRSPKIRGALEGYRIVQVSDLHNRTFGKGNCHLLALIQAQLPDLIVITGDLMDSYLTNLPKAVEFAACVSKIAPTFFVTGNHEHRLEKTRLEGFLSDLEAAGVTVLRNRALEMGMGADHFRLIGVDCQQGKTETLQALMQDRPEDELNILLSHKPHYAAHYERAGVDLVLTGHAHGGQWRLPVVGGLYAPGQGVLPKYTAGMYRLDHTVMIVSRGLGNSSFPIRINNYPELVTVTMRSRE